MSHVKDQLKRIATERAQEGGIHAVTMRDIGEAVGIKSSSVMYHFRSKDGLMMAITEDYHADFLTQLAQIDRAHNTALGRLEAFVGIFEDTLVHGRFCLCGMMAAELQTLDDDTRAAVGRFFQSLESWVAGVIQEASPERSAQACGQWARMVISGLEGALLLDKIEGQPVRLTVMKGWIATLLA